MLLKTASVAASHMQTQERISGLEVTKETKDYGEK